MEFIEKKLKGAFEIKLKTIKDSRGFFMRTFDDKIFTENNLDRKWVQENHSRSLNKGIIRGLHFQMPPYAETKLIRAIRGTVLDVFVDLRKDSPTFGQWDSVLLSDDRYNCALIPRGFAHGFCTLTDDCEVVYKVDNYYAPEYECGIIWNDPDINIEWPVKDPILSEKDLKNLSLQEFKEKHTSVEI
jgi:dTDP-4-dehydrorhamnose 3,5-epimerase